MDYSFKTLSIIRDHCVLVVICTVFSYNPRDFCCSCSYLLELPITVNKAVCTYVFLNLVYLYHSVLMFLNLNVSDADKI